MLGPIDYLAIAGYLIILLIVGWLSGRNESTEGFLISERKLGILSGISTINATKMGSIMLIYTAFLYDYGASAFWYFTGVVVGYIVFVPLALHLHRLSAARYYTLADYFKHQYNNSTKRWASLCSIVLMGGFLAVNVIAAAQVLSFYSALPYTVSVLCIISIVALYLLMAGFQAVVRTDVFQYIVIVVLLLVFLAPLQNGTHIPADNWTVWSAGADNIIGFLLFGIFIPFASPDLWQRVYAMPSRKCLLQSLIGSIIIYLPVCMLLTWIGLLIKTRLPDISPDIALVHGFAHLLPIGLKGLAVVIFFAAFMSTIDTYAYTAASAIVQDFIPSKSKHHTVRRIRLTVACILLLAALTAICLANIIQAAFIFAGVYVVLAIPAIASAIHFRIYPVTLLWSFRCGAIAMVTGMLWGVFHNELSPTLSLKVLAGSLMGLVIGAIIARFRQKRVH